MSWLAAIALLAPAAGGQDAFLDQLLTAYRAQTPLARVFEGDLAAARRVRDRFVAALAESWGAPVGYKAALTSPPAQRRFDVDRPVLGVLLEPMILAAGAPIKRSPHAPFMCEVDLLARVSDPEALARADEPMEALAGIDALAPFVELPDRVYRPDLKLNAAAIVAVNAGARSGVRGPWIPLAGGVDWRARLAELKVAALDRQGRVLGEGQGSALLGHPLAAVLWLRDALRAEGKALRAGDWLSLGSLTPPIILNRPSDTRPTLFIARYAGLLDSGGVIELRLEFDYGEGAPSP